MSPYLAVDLVEHSHPHVAEALLALSCSIAAVLTWLLPIETKARSLQVKPNLRLHYGPVSQSVRLCVTLPLTWLSDVLTCVNDPVTGGLSMLCLCSNSLGSKIELVCRTPQCSACYLLNPGVQIHAM